MIDSLIFYCFNKDMESGRFNRPFLLGVAGAAVLAGGLALTFRGRSREVDNLRSDMAERTGEVMNPDSGPIDRPARRILPRIPDHDPGADTLAAARNGDREAAREIVKLVVENDGQGPEGYGVIGSQKVGIPWEEFTTYRVAGEVLKALDRLNNPPEDHTSDSPNYTVDYALWNFYQSASFQAEVNEPYDPLFLKLIGMEENELRDRIEEAVIQVENNIEIFPDMLRPSPEQLADIRSLFGIDGP